MLGFEQSQKGFRLAFGDLGIDQVFHGRHGQRAPSWRLTLHRTTTSGLLPLRALDNVQAATEQLTTWDLPERCRNRNGRDHQPADLITLALDIDEAEVGPIEVTENYLRQRRLVVAGDAGLSAGVGLMGTLWTVFVEESLVGALLLIERAEVFDVGGVPVAGPGRGR